ncbi:MAG: inositol monophosphatase family protein, partial [Verrucomicrobiota bacterium]
DIKIELDRRTQALITDILLGDHPDHAIIGEEGNAGDEKSDHRWIVDPIDGTVNYFFGIPHFCVSIALREGEKTLLGVVYDPMRDELFSTTWDSEPTRNGSRIQVSSRATLSEAIITVGFSKTNEGLEEGVDRYKRIARQVRKTRMLGSAALGMAYIACGRLDAYLEESVSDWDIAAGELLIQRAGGTVLRDQKPNSDKIRVCSSNGKLPLQEIWS